MATDKEPQSQTIQQNNDRPAHACEYHLVVEGNMTTYSEFAAALVLKMTKKRNIGKSRQFRIRRNSTMQLL